MNDSLQNAYIEETTELLSELEITLLAVEDAPTDTELIAKLFRALHTIKGSSAMFGFDDIAMFTHDIETAYDLIRNGKLLVTKQIIDLTLLARDEIANMLAKTGGKSRSNEGNTKKIIESFREIVSGYQTAEKPSDTNVSISKPISEKQPDTAWQLYYIRFVPSKDLFLTGTNPLMLIDELREMGDLAVSAFVDKIPAFENFNPESCYCYWDILIRTQVKIDTIRDVFIFVSDSSELTIENITKEIGNVSEIDFVKLQESISADSNFHTHSLRSLIKTYYSPSLAGVSEPLNDRNLLNERTPLNDRLHTAAKQNQQTAAEHAEADSQASIRVNAGKIDELVNLVGELVTIQAQLSENASRQEDQVMITIAEEVERITWALRDIGLNIRMLPIGTTFSKFKRLVRDLSRELGKEVELTTDGAETELDKTVLEKLSDPLVHIIRNCIDHGIEMPDVREKVGKDRVGKVHLTALQSGGNVLIQISDNGAGIDKQIIKEKAIQNGLVSESAELTDAEIYSLIFMSGFSTAKQVTNVSGRGVGMDVVKRAIEALRGVVEVESTLGKGTTITMKLPLTLAIIDGLLVKIGDDSYVLPLSSVEECIELSRADIQKAHGRHIVNVRGSIVPYISLRERFGITSERPDIEQVVIAAMNERSIGFVVDQVLGQHQTVLKSLGKYYKNVEGVSGATILGDGTVALILDIKKLIEREELEEKN